ncbi:MAG: tyrosine-type recombinase/integrase [Eubacterium sp.]
MNDLYNTLDEFMTYCDYKVLSHKTILSYEQALRLFIQYLENEHNITKINAIKEKHIKAYMKYLLNRGKYTVVANAASVNCNYPHNRTDYEKDISNATVNNYLRNIKVFFNFLYDNDYISCNPCKRIKYLKQERKPLYFITDCEFNLILNNMDISKFPEYRDYIIIQLLLDSGMRIGETLQTKTENVNIKRNSIYLPAVITKGKQSRTVFYSDKVARLLKLWLNYKDRYRDSEYLFCTNQGKPLTVGNFETNFKKYCKRVGIENAHPHTLRNNFAKRFLMNGGDIYTLSRLLGHSSVTVTEAAYIDFTNDDLAKKYFNSSPINNLNKRGI